MCTVKYKGSYRSGALITEQATIAGTSEAGLSARLGEIAVAPRLNNAPRWYQKDLCRTPIAHTQIHPDLQLSGTLKETLVPAFASHLLDDS